MKKIYTLMICFILIGCGSQKNTDIAAKTETATETNTKKEIEEPKEEPKAEAAKAEEGAFLDDDTRGALKPVLDEIQRVRMTPHPVEYDLYYAL